MSFSELKENVHLTFLIFYCRYLVFSPLESQGVLNSFSGFSNSEGEKMFCSKEFFGNKCTLLEKNVCCIHYQLIFKFQPLGPSDWMIFRKERVQNKQVKVCFCLLTRFLSCVMFLLFVLHCPVSDTFLLLGPIFTVLKICIWRVLCRRVICCLYGQKMLQTWRVLICTVDFACWMWFHICFCQKAEYRTIWSHKTATTLKANS